MILLLSGPSARPPSSWANATIRGAVFELLCACQTSDARPHTGLRLMPFPQPLVEEFLGDGSARQPF